MEIIRTELVYDYEMPYEFVRLSWVSARAREVWDPIFQHVSNLIVSVEQEAVKTGLKKVAIQSVSQAEFKATQKYWAEFGKSVVSLDKVPVTDIYQSSGRELKPNEQWAHKVAIGDPPSVNIMLGAYKDGNSIKQGELLGYPRCCAEFFQKYWINDHWLDTTYPMSDGYQDIYDWDPACNILHRWNGIRPVSHLPCSFNCKKTKEVAELYRKLMIEMGHGHLMDKLYEILSWPVEWTGLHGIAIVSTPICRIIVRSDALAFKKSVCLHSDKYPHEAGVGLKFPYKQPPQMVSTNIGMTDNGFSSLEAETKAHNLIIDLIADMSITSAIDLGCGNMALLDKIGARLDFGDIFGVDNDPSKNPTLVTDIFDLNDFHRDFDLALISANRLHENPDGWKLLLPVIENHCRFLVVYSYNGIRSKGQYGEFRLIRGVSDQGTYADLYAKIASVN